jgi:hypothetical protein
MKKQTAIELAGGQARLASLLGITTGAISQWGENIPQARVWQLRLLRPQWFIEQKRGGAKQAPSSTEEAA